MIKDSVQPIELYTCDVDLVNLENKVKIGDIDRLN